MVSSFSHEKHDTVLLAVILSPFFYIPLGFTQPLLSAVFRDNQKVEKGSRLANAGLGSHFPKGRCSRWNSWLFPSAIPGMPSPGWRAGAGLCG